MKTKHTPLPEIAPVPWDASGEYVYDANGKQVHLYAERQMIARACNSHADLLAALEGLLAATPRASEFRILLSMSAAHEGTETGDALYAMADRLEAAITAARAAIEKAGRGVEGGGE